MLKTLFGIPLLLPVQLGKDLSKLSTTAIAVWGFVLLCQIFYSASSIADNKVRVGIYQNPPKIYLDKQGQPSGFFPGLLNLIAEQEGWSLQYVSCAWSECLQMIENGELDLMPDVALSKERAKRFDFNQEVAFSSWSQIYAKEKHVIRSFLDLDGKRIAVLKDSYQARKLMEQAKAYDIQPTLIEVLHFSHVFELIEQGRVDAGIVNRFIGAQQKRNYQIVETDLVLFPVGVHFAAPKGKSQDLLGRLDKQLVQLKAAKGSEYYRLQNLLSKSAKRVKVPYIQLTKEERSWLNSQEKIRIGIEADFAPYSFRDENGRYVGVVPDLMEKISSLSGISFEIVPDLKWIELLEGVKNRDLDIIVPASRTTQRESFLNFPDPLITTPLVIITRKGDTQIRKADDLNGKKVALVRGFNSSKRVINEHPTVIQHLVDTAAEGLHAVAAGEADAYVGAIGVNDYIIRQKGFLNLETTARYNREDNAQGFAVRKDWPHLASILNKTQKAISEEEKLAILNKWVAVDAKWISPDQAAKVQLTTQEQTWIKEHPSLQLGFNPHMEPFLIQNNDGTLDGIIPKIYDELSSVLGVDFKIEVGDWHPIVQKARNRDIDGLLLCATPQAKASGLMMTQPLYSTYPIAFTRDNADFSINSLDDLKGKKIAYQNEVKLLEVALDKNRKTSELIAVNSTLAAIGMVLEGKADIAFALNSENYMLTKYAISGIKLAYSDYAHDTEIGICIRDDYPEAVSMLNKGLEHIGRAKIQNIISQWTGLQDQQKELGLTTEERAWLKANPVIDFYMDDSTAPYQFRSANGEATGIVPDILDIIEEKLGIRFNRHMLTPDEQYRRMVAGESPLLVWNLKGLDSKLPYLTSNSIFEGYYSLFGKSDSDVPVIPEQIRNKKIGVLPAADDQIMTQLGQHNQLIEIAGTQALISALLSGEVDYIVDFTEIVRYFLVRAQVANIKLLHTYGDPDRAGFLVHRDKGPFASILNKVIADIEGEELHDILAKWYGKSTQTAKSGLLTGLEPLVVADEVIFKQTTKIVKWLAGLFAATLLFMFVYWVAQGRPKQLSIRLSILFISVAIAGLIVAISVLVMLLIDGEQRQEAIENRKHESIQLAYELKQSSDDLTRFARTFAVTGDSKYAEYFQAIVRIRDGIQAHPKAFTPIFWDQISAGLIELDKTGEKYSIEARMLELGLSEKESGFLKQAKFESDNLINLENIAMNAVRGLYRDDKGNFTIKDKPNMEMARELLHGKQYHDSKARIMKPINDFFIFLERRTENELQTERAQNKAVLLAIAGLIGLTIFVLVLTYLLFQRRMVKPIEIMKAGAFSIKEGDYHHRIGISSQDELGELSQAFDAMAHSIQERTADLNKAKQEAEVAREETQRRSEEFRKLVDNIPGVFYRVKHEPRWPSIYWSQGTYELTGYTAKEFMEDKISYADVTHPDDLQKLVDIIDEKVKSREVYDITYRIVRKTGEIRWVREIGIYFDRPGEEPFLDGYILDVHDERLMQEHLKAAKKAAEAASQAKSVFLASMSHELRTPMNAILGFSELLHKSSNLAAEEKSNLEIIQRSGSHLLELINEVLDLAKVEAGRMQLENKPFDLADLIEGVITLMRVRAEPKGLEILLDQSSNFPRFINADAGKLRQILVNYLSNAVKYSDSGDVIVKLDAEDGMLYIEVSDSGAGIATKDLKFIFEPFVQVGDASAQTGTGLGLAITKEFAELLGGSVGVDSELERGSRFWVKVPYQVATPSEIDNLFNRVRREVIGLEASQQNTRVLIVEDQQDSRKLLRNVLGVLGLQVKEALDGQQAVDTFKEWHPDFIWMDRHMPVMGGEEATRTIRQLPGGDKVVIVALTASAMHEERGKIMSSGMDDYVSKPYRAGQIYEVMQKYLQLNYLYSKEKAEIKPQQQVYSLDELSTAVAELEPELLNELYTAAQQLYAEPVEAVAKKIEAENSELAGTLRQLVQQFQYKLIVKAIEPILNNSDVR